MTLKEIDNEFDIFYDNLRDNSSPGLTSYEKSVLLTEAQEQYVITLYSQFESDEQTRRILAPLVRTKTLTLTDNKATLPEDCWYILREKIDTTTSTCSTVKTQTVIPLKLDQYDNIVNNPFKNKKIYRLDEENKELEILNPSNYTLSNYTITYLKRPDPIILEDFTGELAGYSINGISDATDPELPDSEHRKIISTAVALATAQYSK